MLLPANEAAQEWGSSYSALSKMFGGVDALPEKIIMEKKIIPKWIVIKSRRYWKLTEIAKWLLEAEEGKK